MAKRKNRPPRERRQLLTPPRINMTNEANYIIERAQKHDARVVSLGMLIFFSTAAGDAWVLDPSESLALCLARAGERQPFEIIETATQCAINWKAHFQIEADQFLVIDEDGQTQANDGYPTRELTRHIRRLLRG